MTDDNYPVIGAGKYIVYLSNIDTKDVVLQNTVVTREALGTLMIYMLAVTAADVAMIVDRLDSPVQPEQIRWMGTNPNYPFEMLVTKSWMI